MPQGYYATVHLLLPPEVKTEMDAVEATHHILSGLVVRMEILDWEPALDSEGNPIQPRPIQLPGDFQEGDFIMLLEDEAARNG